MWQLDIRAEARAIPKHAAEIDGAELFESEVSSSVRILVNTLSRMPLSDVTSREQRMIYSIPLAYLTLVEMDTNQAQNPPDLAETAWIGNSAPRLAHQAVLGACLLKSQVSPIC